MSEYLIAIVLGIVEGITEFLPVSSTGHLIVVGNLLGFTGERASTFEIFIQSGAILAVVVLYFKRFLGVFDFSATTGVGFKGRSAFIKLGLACGPFFILGALFGKKIKHALFSPSVVAYALIVGGIIMLLVERNKKVPTTKTLEDITFKQALSIGIVQCAALWPGISRSGATIVAALLGGTTRGVAAEFSFLVAVPILLVATAYDLLKSVHALNSGDLSIFAIGFVVSFVFAIFAVKGFISALQRWTFVPFAWYRILAGVLILAFMLH